MSKIEFPCHLREMFIRHDGVIFPCCRKWGSEHLAIGSITDLDIEDKVLRYDADCSCLKYRFRRIQADDELHSSVINIEFPLTCNGKCAMCCVKAPFKQRESNRYDYEALARFVEKYDPDRLSIQGGEVLVQPKTIEWIVRYKKKFPDKRHHIITNGCVGVEMIRVCKMLFSSMTISIVGFQQETYRTIMGLDIEKTKKFVRRIIDDTDIVLSLKYLCTPLNVHEMGLFLDWATEMKPNSIQFVDADLMKDINLDRPILYWRQVLDRALSSLINRLEANKAVLNEHGIVLFIDQKIMEIGGLTVQKLVDDGFTTVVRWG